MSEWKRRIVTAWWVLIGRQCLLTTATQQTIYVESAGRPGTIVQLTYYRDDILALDNQGTIWLLKSVYGSTDFQIQHVMESPRRHLA